MDLIRGQFNLIEERQNRIRDLERSRAEREAKVTLVIGFALALVWFFLTAVTGRAQITQVSEAYENAMTEIDKTRLALQQSHDELETRVRERTLALTAANAELEAFCYSVSHDLRAPLRGIDGFSLALIEDYSASLGEEGGKFLRYVREGVQRMGKLIDDLLSLSRISRGDLKKVDFDFSLLANSVGLRQKTDNPDRVVEFTVQDGLVAKGDLGLIEAALENLLSNAWKFSQKTSNAKVEIGQILQDGDNVFFIRDNGAGFDMKHSAKLFGPFQRLHTAQDFQGNGVGLATVKRIINRHGGRIWADSKRGEGATFYFTL